MRYLLALVLLLVSVPAFAQYTTASKWKWSAADNAMDVADAQAAQYKLYLNGATTGIVLTGVACVAPEPGDVIATCTAPFLASVLPVVNRRLFTATISAKDTDPAAVDSAPSAPLLEFKPFNPPGRPRTVR